MDGAAPFWACVRTEPHREATAARFLVEVGNYEVYWPRIRERRIRQGRRIFVVESLFSNYLFCRITLGWWTARWTAGVASVIMDGDRPAKVADAIVDGIRAREADGFVELPRAPPLRPGTPVKVTTGLFCGSEGLYEGQRANDRVAVLLLLLGAPRLITLSAANIEAA